MATTITINLPDELASQLSAQASQHNLSKEDLILQYLAQHLEPSPPSSPISPSHPVTVPNDEEDPLLRSIGTLELGTTDLGENHDYYIGQALIEELNPSE